MLFVFFKQKTAYEMRISDWSSDVCSSDLCSRRGSSACVSTRCPAAGAKVAARLAGSPMSTYALGSVFSPTSVAVVGASPRERSLGRLVLRQLREGGFAGPVGLVNPNYREKIGRASCRERVCQYVMIAVVGGSLKKKKYKE